MPAAAKSEGLPEPHLTAVPVSTPPAIAAPSVPRIQRITTLEDIAAIEFTDGMAAVEVPFSVVEQIEFKNDHRSRSERMLKLERSIRSHGYTNTYPIIARIGRKGRWVIIDGGHRLTAARRIAHEWLTNLVGPKVNSIYFLLFTTDASWSKLRDIACHTVPNMLLPEVPTEVFLDEDETVIASPVRPDRS
ncbi:MAG: ParB/RepB/Spo0J family partition protein [Pseudomonadota bacterium]